MLPRHATNHECISPSKLCFNAGDDRCNEQPGLAVIHTLMMRDHNRRAEQMAGINPHWPDEKIFQEVRKIEIGIIQHITFHEYFSGGRHCDRHGG